MKFIWWLLTKFYKSDYEGIDLEKMNEWLLTQSLSQGFRSYFKYRDLAILKEIGKGVKQSEYWRLVGQRYELLMLVGKINEVKRLAETKKYVKEDVSKRKK